MKRIMTLALNWCGLQYRLAVNVLVAAWTQWRANGGRLELTKKSRPPFASGEERYQLEVAQRTQGRNVRFVREAIYAYNRSKAGDQRYQELTIWLRDNRHQIVGGLLGSTYWEWLLTDFLWVDEGIRGRGYGRQLLIAAEQEALRRGCRHACLETFSFQAPTFYEKLGYVVFGVLDDFPGEHKRYSLKKELEWIRTSRHTLADHSA